MPSHRPETEAHLEARVVEWLAAEAGVDEFRRVVRAGPAEIVVSKFEEGFAARLHATIAQLPELFDDATVEQAYLVMAADRPALTRVACWHESLRGILAAAVGTGRVSVDECAEVLAGIDSVAALLDSVLWTGPVVSDDFVPGAGERDAYREAIERMDADRGLFTRYYGAFEGVPVVNHCPGAPFARRMFEQAWRICAGTLLPGDGRPV